MPIMDSQRWFDDHEWVSRGANAITQSDQDIREHLVSEGLDDSLAERIALALNFRAAAMAGMKFKVVRSPIEAMFLLSASGPCFTHQVTISYEPVGFEPYRPDFVLIKDEQELVVELDGHEFHERTPEQAEHDKKRDRWFAAQGHRVVRFTGREVWRDPRACVDECLSILLGDD